MTKDVISLSISVLLLFRHYISHKITFGAPSSGGVLCSACGAFIENLILLQKHEKLPSILRDTCKDTYEVLCCISSGSNLFAKTYK